MLLYILLYLIFCCLQEFTVFRFVICDLVKTKLAFFAFFACYGREWVGTGPAVNTLLLSKGSVFGYCTCDGNRKGLLTW